jgi:hypothetical protein
MDTKKIFYFFAVAKVRQGFFGKKGKGIGDIREEKEGKNKFGMVFGNRR